MNASEVYWKAQARAIREAAEAWKQDHDEGQSVLELEAFLDHLLETCGTFRKIRRQAWEALFAGRLADPLGEGARVRALLGLLAQGFEVLVAVLREHQGKGSVIARAGDLARAATDLRAWEGEFRARWPRFDPDQLQAVLSAPGEFVDPEEIYREFPELRRENPS